MFLKDPPYFAVHSFQKHMWIEEDEELVMTQEWESG